jgi:parvulin-like peptidyl-prolyl isomerase
MLVAAIGCVREHSKDRILGRIGDYELTEEHFQAAFKIFYSRTGQSIPINEVSKKSVFESEFNKYVLATYAKDFALHEKPEAVKELAAIQRSTLVKAYLKRHFFDTLKADLRVSQEMFRRSRTSLRASHLYARTKKQADSLYGLVKAGYDFETLAKNNFNNKILSASGGDLGYFTLDDMDYDFEDAAYRLKVGEVSKPVKTAQGYSIIKLTDIVPAPISTDMDFYTSKPVFDQIAEVRQRHVLEQAHLNEVLSAYTIGESTVEQLWILFENWRESGDFQLVPFPIGVKPSDYAVTTVDNSRGFTVEDLLHEVSIAPLELLEKVVTKEDFMNLIKGSVYQMHVVREAKKEGLHKENYYTTNVEYAFVSYLIDAVERNVDSYFVIDSVEIESEFRKRGFNFVKPAQYNLLKLAVSSLAQANNAIKEIESGKKQWSDIVRNLSVENELVSTGGALGWVSHNDLGTLGHYFRNKKTGDIVGPISVSSNRFEIYKVLDRRESSKMSYAEACNEIERQLRLSYREKNLKQIVDDTKRRHSAFVNDDYIYNLNIKL